MHLQRTLSQILTLSFLLSAGYFSMDDPLFLQEIQNALFLVLQFH